MYAHRTEKSIALCLHQKEQVRFVVGATLLIITTSRRIEPTMTSHGSAIDWSPGSTGAGEAPGMQRHSHHSLSNAADDDFLSVASSSNAAPSPVSPVKAFHTAINGIGGKKSASRTQISGNATARKVSISPATTAITNAKSNAAEERVAIVENAVSKKCYDIFNIHALFEDLM